jgi:hypothetical protein
VIALVILLSPLVVVLMLLVVIVRIAYSVLVHLVVWVWWLPRGQDVLFVYSDSPVWHDYIEAEVLPIIRQRAVLLNWSERKRWSFGLAPCVFRHFGGTQEFNPLGVVFHPLKRAQVFRFWQPFRDWKHGREGSLKKMQAEFFRALGLASD